MSADVSAALTFVVPGPPVPWERVAGGHVPPRTRAYKRHVAVCALAGRSQFDAGAARRPLGESWWRSEPCAVVLVVYRLPVRGKRLAGDVDNLAKVALDAMSPIVYTDDSLVRALSVRIVDCAEGRERLEVSVTRCAVEREVIPDRERVRLEAGR